MLIHKNKLCTFKGHPDSLSLSLPKQKVTGSAPEYCTKKFTILIWTVSPQNNNFIPFHCNAFELRSLKEVNETQSHFYSLQEISPNRLL